MDKLLISTDARTDIDSVAVLGYVHVVAEVLNVSRCADVYSAFVVLLCDTAPAVCLFVCVV